MNLRRPFVSAVALLFGVVLVASTAEAWLWWNPWWGEDDPVFKVPGAGPYRPETFTPLKKLANASGREMQEAEFDLEELWRTPPPPRFDLTKVSGVGHWAPEDQLEGQVAWNTWKELFRKNTVARADQALKDLSKKYAAEYETVKIPGGPTNRRVEKMAKGGPTGRGPMGPRFDSRSVPGGPTNLLMTRPLTKDELARDRYLADFEREQGKKLLLKLKSYVSLESPNWKPPSARNKRRLTGYQRRRKRIEQIQSDLIGVELFKASRRALGMKAFPEQPENWDGYPLQFPLPDPEEVRMPGYFNEIQRAPGFLDYYYAEGEPLLSELPPQNVTKPPKPKKPLIGPEFRIPPVDPKWRYFR